MEKWDLFDENRQPLNKVHYRGEEIAKGHYHVVVGIWTINSQNKILLTLRHPDKDFYPDCWENTGGCVRAGEASLQGAKRELFEETGIDVTEEEFILLKTERTEDTFSDTYIVRVDRSIEELVMQEGETVAAKWVTLEELDQMVDRGEVGLPIAEKFLALRDELKNYLEKTIIY